MIYDALHGSQSKFFDLLNLKPRLLKTDCIQNAVAKRVKSKQIFDNATFSDFIVNYFQWKSRGTSFKGNITPNHLFFCFSYQNQIDRLLFTCSDCFLSATNPGSKSILAQIYNTKAIKDCWMLSDYSQKY